MDSGQLAKATIYLHIQFEDNHMVTICLHSFSLGARENHIETSDCQCPSI
jgi:hypothetical protein